MRTALRPRRLVPLLATSAAIAVLGTAGIVHVRADRSWQAMQAMADGLQQRLQARPHHRQALWGEARPGSAFSHYEQAMQKAHDLGATDKDALLAMLPRTDADTAEAPAAQALLARWQPVLEALHAGAHAADATPPAAPTAPGQPGMTNLLDARWVVNLAMFEARALRHRGDGLAAVHRSLDAATFAVDLHRRGTLIDQMIASAVVAIATTECWTEPGLARLDATALAALAGGLERLDAALPETLDFDGELSFSLRSVLSLPTEQGIPSMFSAWRYGFSTRWMLADAMLRTARTNHELGAATTLAWPQRRALLDLELGALQACGNPIVAMTVPNLATAERGLRETTTLVRLLRMSVALHRGLDLPPLRDPLGDGPLRVTRQADGSVRLHGAGTEWRQNLVRTVTP